MAHKSGVYGVGINDADWQVAGKINGIQWTCPYYATWKSMFVRAYSPSYAKKQPTYEGVTVDPAWHSLRDFRTWMALQPWHGWALDKDLLVWGNSVYGPGRCAFVPQYVNNCFRSTRRAEHGGLLMGVSSPLKMRGSPRPYMACISSPNGSSHLGHYATEQLAHASWQAAKADAIRQVAWRYAFETFAAEDVALAILGRAERIDRARVLKQPTIYV